MADEEVATRAPESDAAAKQPSAISEEDTKAQEGLSMGVNEASLNRMIVRKGLTRARNTA